MRGHCPAPYPVYDRAKQGVNFMKLIASLVAASALTLVPASAQASDWWLISPDGNHLNFAEASSIVNRGDSTRTAWFRGDILVGPKMNQYAMVRMQVDCVDRSFKVLQSTIIHVDDRYTKDGSTNSAPIYAHPGSAGWDSIEFICKFDAADAADGKFGTAVRLPPELSEPGAFVAARRKSRIAKHGYKDDADIK